MPTRGSHSKVGQNSLQSALVRTALADPEPRPETEAYTAHLADRLVATLRRQSPPELSSQGLTVIDFCTGTGCIALDLYGRIRRAFPSMPLRVRGVDISPAAVTLARQNLARNIRLNHLPADGDSGSTSPPVQFSLGDIFSSELTTRLLGSERRWDVMVSNPPYISRRGFALNTARSVRNWEPRTALVPKSGDGEEFVERGCEPEDVFYARLLEIAALLKPKTMLFEVADMEQAIRVVQMAKSIRQGILEPGRALDPSCVEIWKDTITSDTGTVRVGNYGVVVRGTGHGRSVYISMNSETLGST